MSSAFSSVGANANASFTLRLHRGDGMVLVAMNWRSATPPRDFVGFAIEYREPRGDRFFALKNRISFPSANGDVDPNKRSTKLSPIQKFRWVHFPRNAELSGDFTYRVTPVFMNPQGELSYGEHQEAKIELRRETYPDRINVTFTRGFVSSQAFVDNFSDEPIKSLLPPSAKKSLDFTPTHSKATEALTWMGFEARSAILEVLDQAIADADAAVEVVAYDLNEPEIVSRLERLGSRLRIIIDDEGDHGAAGSSESKAAKRLRATAGNGNVKRQHMGGLQHNKTVVADGPTIQAAVCGSTNLSWRGLYVQSNNAVILKGRRPVQILRQAFEDYWSKETPGLFGATRSADWQDLGLRDIDAQIGFSPRSNKNAVLKSIADDIANGTQSSLLFSLAFLYQTPGAIQSAVKKIKTAGTVFCYGISDHAVKGLVGIKLDKPNGKVTLVQPAALKKNLPKPFSAEPTGGSGTRMHHKFVVIDFNKPSARVYVGSFNFSVAADTSNGENLLVIRDRRVATSYAVEAVRIFDHYHFRVAQEAAKKARKKIQLSRSPRTTSEKPWWHEHYSDPRKIQDRLLFA